MSGRDEHYVQPKDLPDHARLYPLSLPRCRQAVDHFRQELALYRETGDRAGESEALNGLGEVLLVVGQPGPARTEHTAALSLASQTGDKYEQAHAHNGLGMACHAAHDPGPSRRHWQEALTLYTNSAHPP